METSGALPLVSNYGDSAEIRTKTLVPAGKGEPSMTVTVSESPELPVIDWTAPLSTVQVVRSEEVHTMKSAPLSDVLRRM